MNEIDLVIPMVFPQDLEWQREYARACGGGDAMRNVRYRSWGTEGLLIRCCQKYMPWLRTIHVLLASPSQAGFLDEIPTSRNNEIPRFRDSEGPAVRLVFHRDFIPEKYLPCFSSPCIEMFLHRIPGLSEHFIYANDDMFPLSPLEPEDFFRNTEGTEGTERILPCQMITEKPYPAAPNTFQKKCMFQQNMVGKPFGKHYTTTWLKNGHSFAPILKSVCEEVWRRHGAEITANLSPLKRTDKSCSQYVYSLYQHFAGIAIAHAPKEQYLGPGTATDKIAAIIRDPDCGILCLNDNGNIRDWEKRAAIVRKEIGEKLKTDNRELKMKEPLDVLIVHYNTQELTEAAIKSLRKHTPNCRVTVFDNSDKRPFVAPDGLQIKIIDNTKGQHIDLDKWLQSFPEKDPTNDNRYASARHCKSIDYCMDLFPDGFLLVDSDVLVKQDVTPLFDSRYAWVGQAKPHRSKYKVRLQRVLPFLCYINTKMCKEHGIRYCNPEKMYGLSMRQPDTSYDTGCWFYEACNSAKVPVHVVQIDDYILHLGHASWQNRDADAWLREHRGLWQERNDNVRIYVCTHTDFKAVVHNKAYEVVDARQWNGDHCENGLRGSFYSELITYKYIAERDALPEYVGFCGYRKYFSFMDNVPDMDEVFGEYDAIATTPRSVTPDVKGQYARSHNVKDLDIVSDIVRKDYPDLWPVYEHSLHEPTLYACNMFIVRRDDFKWMMKTVFDILDKYLAVVGTDIEGRIMAAPQDYHIGKRRRTGVLPYQYRIGGFLGERVVNALLRYRFKRIKHYDKVVTSDSLPQNA